MCDSRAKSSRIFANLPQLTARGTILRAVLFLAHDDAGYITGQVISVNGGWDM
ncbi:MAG: SDR family oxidoreductase [Gammaproteobacteria bacterium]|nr:SDR family oxidoreductase [Gammaproteobacteria bacterium]